jgi:cytochrome c oxidase subunit 1
MFGRHLSEMLGKVHFWGTVIPFNGIFLPLFVLGAAGQHRRTFNFQNFPELASPSLQYLRIVATTSLVIMLLFQLPFLVNFVYSMFWGKRAERNPWRANTLEWVAASPPPHGNFEVFPEVYRPPYEYSVPGRAEDYWPQHLKA